MTVATRKLHLAEEKFLIALADLGGGHCIAELCLKVGFAQSQCRCSTVNLEAEKMQLAGGTARQMSAELFF